MDKSFRIHTNILNDTLLQVNMKQDFDFLEVLSLKLRQKDAYRLHSSNYGVIIGRVLANDAFGIPNAKLSIFVERDSNDSTDMEALYPYSEVTTKDKEGRRYNILPDYSDDDCYRVVGTFPNKRLMLDDDIQLEVYDKYYKYTTVTNSAGDYMIFGVPTGSTTVHVDIDLSDIGVLSQRPYDFEYKGYNLTMFDSPTQFKESTNLDSLAQLFSQNRSVFVYPFWGDADNGIASITRADIQIQYKFEPTCVFMGSIVSDNEGHAIGHRCAPDIENGMNDQLVAGSGTIEMIRKTTDGLVEEYQIQGNQLIDENGVWCYQIPMNLDYIGTDEYGNIVPTDNPNKGIPTRTQVRFRFSKTETSDEGFSRHTAKYLVPMNPIFSEQNDVRVRLDDNSVKSFGVEPVIPVKGSEIEKMYTFGSSTPIHCFRDLYWNNVYSVKNYIPKSQVAHRAYAKNYIGLKGSNLAEDQNPIPFNKLRIDLPFVYIVVCLLFTIVTYIIWFINFFIICTIDDILSIFHGIKNIRIFGVKPFGWLPVPNYLGCIVLSAGLSEGNVAYYPGCRCESGLDASDCPEDMEGSCRKSTDVNELLDKIQRNLALDFKIVKLDLYQDWINGCLYMPLWYWRKSKKKTFLFFTISGAKNEYCSDSRLYSRLKTYVTCNIRYYDNDFTVSDNKKSMPDSENRWHKNRANQVRYERGLIKPVENKDGLTAYYYVATQATSDNANSSLEMIRRESNFKAVRLFATDIILLGNLDPKNIYGIPQFFKCLPSTTANVPPIATIEEVLDPNEKEEIYDKDTSGNADDSGNTITTGMDWNHDGDEKTPRYKTGLFIDLACTYAGTKPKSCINVERISELGVSVDMTHNMAYHENGNSTQYGQIDNDGFITKYELDDMENRAMFATLNHIGFIPQEYQDSISGYTTQVHDKNTNYLIPKFKYIYPVDFDGRMQVPMDLYKNGFEQATFDERDESYITFRMGAEQNLDYKKNSEERIRHFYHARNNNEMYDMPLYNNSYYFYFGIKKGSTAIDKFNKMFYAPCFKQEKMPFTLDIEVQGKSYCPEAYTNNACNCPSTSSVTESEYSGVCRYNYDSKRNKAYGYIKVTSDDIRKPYSYKLYDQFNELIVEDEGMKDESFVIGGQIDNSGNTVSNCNGWIFHQVKNDEDKYERIDENLDLYYSSGLTNQKYTLEVTDADGKTITEKVKLDVPKISGEYKATKLGTKFYNSATTRIDYICHDDNAFYGKIEMTSFSVDGYNCNLTGVQYLGYSNEYTTSSTTIDSEGNKQIEMNTVEDDTRGRCVFCITGESQDISNTVVAYLEISVLKSTEENLMRNCMCDDNSSYPSDSPINLIAAAQNTKTTPVEMKISGATENHYLLGYQAAVKDEDGKTIVEPAKITFYFYQPNRYVVKIIQGCTNCANLIMDNSSEEIITIQNGEPFITTLNKMPTKFILGTVSDTNNASIANTSYFYRSSAVRNETDYNIKGWYGLHEEDSYMFSRRDENKTYNYNQLMWEDFFKNATDDVASPGMKRTILKFKFDNMFKLSEGAYITTDSSCKLDFEARGGVSPILYRMVAPIYNDMEKGRNRYVIKDFFNTQCPQEFPNIVADNYSLPLLNGRPRHEGHYQGGIPDSPHFNQQTYSNHELLGNYFAAFTRDGSYINKRQIDGVNIKIERSPSFASVSPIDSNAPKILGKDDTGSIADKFRFAHTSGTQNLDGDERRNVQPYLRGIYVDRRFDYDFTVLAPVIGNNISLYTDRDRNIVWKGGRLSGWTYNGIEMSYDENYNIISADTHSGTVETYSPAGEPIGTDVEYSAATFNKRLEYTYKYDCAHRCLTCGYQFKDMVSTCPNCHSTNIRYFHGENVEQQKTSKIITSYNEQEDRVYSAYTYEPTIHIADRENFNGGETRIPGIVVTPPNEASYTLDDAVTYYHKWNGDWNCDWKVKEPVWGRWNVNRNQNGDLFGFYDKRDIEESQTPLIKEYYTSYINNFDIRHLYWSLFNYDRLKYYTTDNPNQQRNGYGQAAINNPNNPFYVYRYPLDYVNDPEWYNGDFNRDDVVQNTSTNTGRVSQTSKVPYPTKRFIDIGNLPSVSLYTYETQCCSYSMKSYITDDGKIMAETDGGETAEINLQWIRPVTIIPPNASSTDYANITYNPYPGYCGHEPFTDCVKFSAATASMAFKYNSYTCDDFEVYTKTPRIIQVLPYINGRDIDGIGFYKTCNPRTEFNGIYGDNLSLSDAINFITLDAGRFENESVNIWELIRGGNGGKNIFLPENVEKRDDEDDDRYVTKYGVPVNGSFFVKKDEWLVSDDDDFTNIEFRKNLNSLYNSSTHQKAVVFTILVEREYRYVDDDNLVRHINTVETTDLYDCRDLFMKITLRGRTAASSADTELTYVEMREGGVSGISGVNESSTSYGEEEIKVDVSGEGGKSSGTIKVPTTDAKDTELGKDTTKIYIQTITFDMKFDTNSGTSIPDRQNESFADYSMMSYVFRFFNRNSEQFDVIPSEVFMFEESTNVNVLRFTLRWPVNMGIVADPQWSGKNMGESIPVEVYARTPSNFIYKLSNFMMAFCCGQDVNGTCKRSSNVEDDIKAPMKPSPGDDGNPVKHISHLRIDPSGTSCNCDF